MLGKSVSQNSLILGLFALVTAGILALTYQGTADKIALEERRAAQRAFLELLPDLPNSNSLLDNTLTLSKIHSTALGLETIAEVNVARKNSQPVAVILPSVAPDGYSGKIKLAVGIYADGSLSGVRVLAHRETPGLGDKIETKKSDWILGFRGKSLEQPEPMQWQVKKDGGAFDQFTGATITPRAVVRRVKQTLEFYRANKTLFIPETDVDSPQTPKSTPGVPVEGDALSQYR
ncbi:MAG: electron transport complex subunit RsxG [Cellvibrionaceae bacterium]|nr:electron transport complex subunit RsxG [Cellvibrionaceae bacterium]